MIKVPQDPNICIENDKRMLYKSYRRLPIHKANPHFCLDVRLKLESLHFSKDAASEPQSHLCISDFYLFARCAGVKGGITIGMWQRKEGAETGFAKQLEV